MKRKVTALLLFACSALFACSPAGDGGKPGEDHLNLILISIDSLRADHLGTLYTHQLPIVDLVPCSCDVLQSGGDYLFAFEKKEHPVTQVLRKIATKIEQF